MLGRIMGAAGALSMVVSPLSLSAFGAAALASTLAAAPAQAATYWGCDTGFTFQTFSTGARCFKPGRVESAPPLPCVKINTPAGAIGAALRIDGNGINDVCATNIGIVVTAEVTCGLGYTMVRVVGADRCEKRILSEERQPSRRFVV